MKKIKEMEAYINIIIVVEVEQVMIVGATTLGQGCIKEGTGSGHKHLQHWVRHYSSWISCPIPFSSLLASFHASLGHSLPTWNIDLASVPPKYYSSPSTLYILFEVIF